ncbi:transcriptional regulator with XRE-family HTH domain [Sporomusaceae bacterium BoRhaA]|uniref:helix-turn-helix domain-containing protein n=1 Tax=Pelorhabdus rhamnosifermentans TaxID=2772457 RepID=UPI001C06170B|nr:XRE family transcriptional regulator [Pelorhabdus rhamnosifermentans]MBU2703363.1 transcriptional regulator with XRE-family HTH domain [Pelorhabdus rhamnosifermentans]
MENLSKIIGRNLYEIRKKKNYSLDKVAELTGVSKPMLGQIERGISNPSVALLWKIASGLNVSFSYFIEESKDETCYVHFNDIQPLYESKSQMAAYPLFPYDDNRKFEIFTIFLQPGCTHSSNPHNDGVEEYIIVTEGQLDLVITENVYKLQKGDALSFPANKKHSYQNSSDTPVCFNNIIYYTR